MAVTVKHSTPADGTFSATGAAAWDADHNFTGTIDVANGGTGAATLTSNALLKGNGTSAISASTVLDDGTNVTTTSNLGIGITYPSYKAQISGSLASTSVIAQSLNVQGGTNLLTYSAQFDNVAWTKSSSTITANATTSPNGTVDADKLIPAAASIDGRVVQPFTGSIGATYTLSLYAKQAEFTNCRLYSDDGASNTASVSYNLATGAVSTAPAIAGGNWTNVSSTSTNVGNGWWRLTLTWTATTVAPTRVAYWCRDTGNGTSGIFIWGAQLEPGTTASPYVATTASAVNGTSSAYFGGPVTLASTNRSAAAWTTSGINLIQSAATFTDTSSTGTVADVRMNVFGPQTLAATNTITATNLYGTYFQVPAAGTNVTASNRFALGADSIYAVGTLLAGGAVTMTTATSNIGIGTNQTTGVLTLGGSSQTANINIAPSTVSQTIQLAYGTTASGSTKTVNIGTNGASGSTTNITVGSATSGATSSITANGQVTLAPIGGSRAAWTTNGIGLIQSAATWTDTSSTGTVSNVFMNRFNAQTVAATNTITITGLYGTYFANPVAGTNVTATSAIALGADSLAVNGSASINGSLSQASGNSFIGGATGGNTFSFGYGTTSSGSTKTVNVGTGGASGSTTNITIGSSTSGATQTTTVNGQVTLAPIGGSAAAWTTSGIALQQSAATWTDTTSTGTVANVYMNRFGAQTVAASNVMTATNLYGTYFAAPVAGTNVTASNRYAIGVDSISILGTLSSSGNISMSNGSNTAIIGGGSSTGAISVGTSTVSQTVNLHTGTTSSGNTKTVNIGTGGASGSTTAITLGSSTSGATQTTTINGRVTLAPIGASAAAWTTSGIALTQSAATWTDTSSTGTVSQVRINNFAAQTMAASNVITVSTLYGAYFVAPTAGTNVTASNTYALGTDSLVVAGAANIGSSGNLILGSSTGTQSVSVGTGTTASGSTKTVNIGTGGASGSTTNITIGSSTSGATSTTTLNGKTAFTGTAQLQGYTVATLPAGTQGMTAFVTDALAPTWNTTLVGGGAVVCKAFFNGTNWVAG